MSAVAASTSARDAVTAAAARLTAAGCESPRLDAELLLAEVLRSDRAGLVMEERRALTAAERERFHGLVARREAREPVAYILGRKPFRFLELEVDARVLIPRPETELLVEAALELPHGARVVDVGTGSGAVALALKQERRDLTVVGADASVDALAVARTNARRWGLDVRFMHADLLPGGRWDALVGNLPYVAEREWQTLPPEIRDHEPRAALVAGDDGLELIRRLVKEAAAVPWLAVEVGAGQAAAVAEMLGEGVETRRDLAGIERVVIRRA